MNPQYDRIKRFLDKGRKAYIFDLDGTLADGTHRLDKLPTENLHLTESWVEFSRLSQYDTPIKATIQVMNNLMDSNDGIIILTGRSDDVERETIKWLADNDCEYDFLVMRSSADNRKDTVIKEEFLRCIGLERIIAAWDDSPKVIEHFRSLGITTYQVCDYGDKLHAGLGSHGVDKLDGCDHFWTQNIEDTHRTCIHCGKKEEVK